MGIFSWLAKTGGDPPAAPSPPASRVEVAAPNPPAPLDYSTLGAQTEEEAERLYAGAKELDPFPDVPPALLNSAHIEDYMLATAMVYPYQRERRKSASYAMRIGNKVAYFDREKPEQGMYHDLPPGGTFTIPPNSLVYFRTKEMFQLPNYMAVRFNLHIELVHKGLLLGTGPLVDPGFSGRLLIPLHNMTANTYVLAEDDEVIWVEFTKTSPHRAWLPSDRQSGFTGGPTAEFAKFPSPKVHLGIDDYFTRARKPHASRPSDPTYPFPANAIYGTVEKASEVAAAAREEAAGAVGTVRRIRNWGIGTAALAGVAVVLPVLGLMVSSWSMVQTTATMAQSDTPGIRALNATIAAMRRDAAARDVADVRLLVVEYCSLTAPPGRVGQPRVLFERLRVARARAGRSAAAAGTHPPDIRMLDQVTPACPAGAAVGGS